MKLTRTILILILLLGFTSSLWAESSGNVKTIAYVGYSKLKPFWYTLGKKVASEISQKENIRYIDLTPATLINKDYVKSLNLAVNRKIDGIIIGLGADVSLIKTILDRAEKLGISVIAIDTPIGHPAVKGFVTTDNYASAQIMGQYLVRKTNKKGTVLILGGTKNHPNGNARRDGVINQARKAGMNVIFRQADWRNELAYKFTREELSKPNDITAIFSCWDPGIISAFKAKKSLNNKVDIILAGFDGLQKVYKDIRDQKISATIAQPIDEMAKQSVNMMIEFLEKKTSGSTVLIPGILVTKDNVEEFIKE